jgi:cobalt-zinc-cadmium efflux system membrane fusion protein
VNVDSTESLPASTTDNEPPPPPGPRWKKRLVFGVGAVGVIAAGIFVLQQSGEAAPSAEAAADVPRVMGDQIRFSENFAQRAGIKIARVRFDQLIPAVAAVGTADFNAEHVAAIGTRLRGLVSSVRKFEGDAVEAQSQPARLRRR